MEKLRKDKILKEHILENLKLWLQVYFQRSPFTIYSPTSICIAILTYVIMFWELRALNHINYDISIIILIIRVTNTIILITNG